MIFRLSRTWLWMRWRIARNSLSRSLRGDGLERVSGFLAIGIPAILAALFVPFSLGLGLAAWFGGLHLYDTGETLSMISLWARLLLGLVTLGVILAPLVRSSTGRSTDARRFLLLPVSAGALHAQILVSAAADPWLLGLLPALLLLPAGVAAAGRPVAAAALLACGLLFFGCLALLGATLTSLINLAFRRRRRAEWISLALLLCLVSSGFFIQFFLADGSPEAPSMIQGADPGPVAAPFPLWGRVFPSEIYGMAMVLAGGTSAGPAGAWLPIAGLLILTGLLYQGSCRLFHRVLRTPETGSISRSGLLSSWSRLTFPGTSPQVSALATAWLRAWFRTLRGKMAWIVPPLFLVFVNLLWAEDLLNHLPGWILLVKGPILAQTGLLMAFLSLQPMLLNQFAVDGPALSATLTQPVTYRQVLRGKRIALALLLAPPALAVLFLSAALGRDGNLWVWASILLNTVAVFLVLATLGSLLSILLPRKADLMSIGKRANPHPAAGLLGTIATGVLLAPGTSMSLARWPTLPAWTPAALLAVWVGVTWAGARWIETLAVDALRNRQETILSLTRGA